jgi:valyl-tRNA synthetase
MLLSSPAGNDLLFEETLCEQGRNFNNKVWNAFRLVKGWEIDPEITQTQSAALAVSCFNARLNQEIELIEGFYKKFRISDILMSLYKLFWDDFSAWYLEMIKPKKGGKIDQVTYEYTVLFFEKLLKLLHPFIPFITEELYHQLKERQENDDLIIAFYPKKESYNAELIRSFEFVKEIVTAIRDFRKNNELKPGEKIHLQILESEKSNIQFDEMVIDFCNLQGIEYLTQKPEATASFFVRKTEYFVPLETAVNLEEEIQKTEEELAYYKGFLSTVLLKLNNEKFIQNAPEQVVALERKKKIDSESKINSLEEKLKKLRK